MANSIVIICGTNRPDAVSLQISLIYQNILKELSVASDVINLAELPEDFAFGALYKNAGKSEAFNPFRVKMKAAAKMIFIVPEYNGSFPGVLKTFIDGLEFPGTFTGKKAALVGLSSGIQGSALAMSHLTDIFNYCGMHVLAYKPKLAKIESHFVDGEIRNPKYAEMLIKQAKMLVEF